MGGEKGGWGLGRGEDRNKAAALATCVYLSPWHKIILKQFQRLILHVTTVRWLHVK